MPEFSAEQLAEWTGGAWNMLPTSAMHGVVHDTRNMRPNAVYLAIRGERFDGHEFVRSAFEAGASAAIVEQGGAVSGVACLEVTDTSKALLDLAAGYRSELGGLVVGITGSAGKTTVKELIVALLAQRGDTASTPGNWNNQIGMPLSLMGMMPTDDFGVFEVGMNQPGEIQMLSEILQPICGVLTTIGLGHVGAFDSVEGIAEEKIALLRNLPAEGVAILDQDSRWYPECCSATKARIVGCSLRCESADYFGQPNCDGSVLTIVDRHRGDSAALPMPMPGSHMMRNVMQATAVAREFGLSWDEIASGLRNFAPPAMRWETVLIEERMVINDAYNANPVSMRSAIKTFAEMQDPAEKWLVLGSMRELGEFEKHAHHEVGVDLSEYAWRGLIAVGDVAATIAEGAESAGIKPEAVWRVDSAGAAAEVLLKHAGEQAAILLKASRLDRLERVLDELRSTAGGSD